MKDKITKLFSSDIGKKVYSSALCAIRDYNMQELLQKGVLVGFSGGADSVMLLCFLLKYREESVYFPITVLHVNHCIRGDEADRDEEFSRRFAKDAGVEFISRKIDVPKLSREQHIGLEECARNCRYLEFRNIILGRDDLSTVCVAHNADDNVETVILNMLRGSGTKGLSGIPPIRDNIVRPLIYASKGDIVSALDGANISFVFDSTNSHNEYKRNYVRNEIVPRLREISESPEELISRASRNLRLDEEYISSVARDFLASRGTPKNFELLGLHSAVFSRVISLMASVSVSSVNLSEIRKLLSLDNFSYSLPEGKRFLCEYGFCRVVNARNIAFDDYTSKLYFGVNRFDDYDTEIILSEDKVEESFLKVYKISIQVDLSSAIIDGDLFIRPKTVGDLIFYGGITRKIKKLFNDRKIPPSLRHFVPLICDGKGVVCLPGFGVRDDLSKTDGRKKLYLTFGIGKGSDLSEKRFYLGSEFR